MHPLLRLLGFFVLVVVVMNVLQAVPVIGNMFHGFFAFWIVAIGLSVLLNHLGTRAIRARHTNVQVRALGHVDSPHNEGKLGSLLLAGGKPHKALAHLEKAVAGEPDSAEWHFRLGSALLQTGRGTDAITSLRRTAEIDEEHGYGQVQLQLSQALLTSGDAEAALACLDVFERNHGPNPESAYRRGVALKKTGRRDEAGASFAQVSELARTSARYQRKDNQKWVLRAFLARFG
jgi:Flp pilus assembly protein TadD